jgi:quercetin dioxygenase-like cupin family protein
MEKGMGAYDDIRRVIVPQERYYSEELSPGVLFAKFYPGGKEGPNGEVHYDTPGGQTWSEYVVLGDPSDAFQMLVPDIRMPANQLWPLHWHDSWTVVLVLEGKCIVGNWCMGAGDVFIAEPSIEYGPLLNGPHGCRLLEIFSQAHLADGGYAPEYRDHPTLQGGPKVFKERSVLNRRNIGHQVLPLGQYVEGTWCGKLESGREWHLGKRDDPERGFMRDTRLAPGAAMDRHAYSDWHFMMVLDGSFRIGERTIEKDGYLLIRPDSAVDHIEAGRKGAHLLELARTAAGAERRPAA